MCCNRTSTASQRYILPAYTLRHLHGSLRPGRPQGHHAAVLNSRKITPLESIESPFVSQDPVQHQAAIDFYTEAYKLQRSKQKHSLHGPLIHINLPNSSDVAKYCPLLATAMLLLAGALLLAPQQGLQLLAGVLHGPPAAHDAVGCCFAQLMGAGYLFQAVVTTLAWGCTGRDELGATTCQRMLMATLLPVPAVLLALNKAAASCCSAVGMLGLGVLQLGMFGVHVLLHLHHHPWFFLKVFWPLAVTMLMTELMPTVVPTNWAFTGIGAGPIQTVVTAVLSFKLFGRLSRVGAKFAPKLAKHWLLPAVNWLAKHALPRLTARLAKVLPRLARFTGRLVPRLTRFGTKLAGRMAPRYAQDQLAGHTQQWAFPEADGLLTDTVAKCIDLMPPKNAASYTYAGLLLVQLMMVLDAYAPDLVFIAAPALPAAAAELSAGAAVLAADAAASAGAAAAEAAVLRFARFSWGAAFFVSAFACDCLKTAADRGHLQKPANRQLNLAVGLLQAGTAAILLKGMESGAVVSNTFAWLQIATVLAGAMFCITQAAAAGLQQQQLLSLAASAAGSCSPGGSTTGSTMGSVHSQQTEPQGDECKYQGDSTSVSSSTGCELTWSESGAVSAEGLEQHAVCQLATAMLDEQQVSDMPSSLLSSVDCETRERRDPKYPAVMSATCNLLTLLQLAL